MLHSQSLTALCGHVQAMLLEEAVKAAKGTMELVLRLAGPNVENLDTVECYEYADHCCKVGPWVFCPTVASLDLFGCPCRWPCDLVTKAGTMVHSGWSHSLQCGETESSKYTFHDSLLYAGETASLSIIFSAKISAASRLQCNPAWNGRRTYHP